MSTIAIRRASFSDFEALQGIVQDGHSEIVQLGRGQISGQLTGVSLGSGFTIKNFSISRGIRSRGILSDHRWMLGVLLSTSGPASVLRHELKAGDLTIVAPGQDRYNVYQGSTRYLAVMITPAELDAFLGSDPGALMRRPPPLVLATDPATATTHIEQLATILGAVAEHAQTLSADAVDFYKRSILETLTAPLRDTRYEREYLTAAALVRDVDRYLIDAGNRPVHISELCEHFGVHRRTLHRDFIDVLGIPPITFLRRKRLGDVNTVLLRGGPAMIIRAVAREHGFADLGKFAAAYRWMFGELPSQTLRRSAPTIFWAASFFVRIILIRTHHFC